MKMLLLIMLISLNANADLGEFFKSSRAQQICEANVYTNGPRIYKNIRFVKSYKDTVYYALRDGANSLLHSINLNTSIEQEFKIEGRLTNLQFFNDEMAVLTQKELMVIDLATNSLKFKISTLAQSTQYKRYAYARGVYKQNGIYYIAHGIRGITVYDSINEKYLPAIKPSVPQPFGGMISMITDIVGEGDRLYITYDDYSLSRQGKAFEGLLIYDLATKEIVKTIPVNQTREAYYQSNMTIDGDELVITNLHLNFRHKKSKLMSDRYMKPLKRIWIYPAGEIVGRGHIQDKKIYGCFYSHKTKKVTSAAFDL